MTTNTLHHGLDVIELQDGERYAVAFDVNEAVKAAADSVLENLWVLESEIVSRYVADNERYLFLEADEDLDPDTNDTRREAVGDKLQDLIWDTICTEGFGPLLAVHDGQGLEQADGSRWFRLN